jgi:hypothetical protein
VSDVELAWWADRAIDDEESNLLAVTAGLGSGKTHGAVQWLYDRIAAHPGAKAWFYMMPIYELIHNTAIPKTIKVLEGFGYSEGRDFTIVRSPFPRCVFRTGSEIHFISGNRPDKIKSVEYGGGVVDEPGVTKPESIKRARERCRDKAAGIPQVLMIGTPEGLNHFADEFDSDKNPGWDRARPRDHELIRKTDAGKVRLRRFRLTTYDNEHNLPSGYITDLLDTHRGNPAYIQAYVHGHFVPLITGGVYGNYKPQKHDTEDAEPSPHRPILMTWDFNAEPLSWISVQRSVIENPYERRRPYICFHESNMGAGQIDDACVEFAVKHPVEKFAETHIKIFGDSSGHAESHKTRRTDYEAVKLHLKNLGYRHVEVCALRHNPLETVSAGALNDWFLNDLCLVCKRLNELKRSLISTRWKEGTRKIDKPAGETHTHKSDALKYLAYAEAEEAGRTVGSYNY